MPVIRPLSLWALPTVLHAPVRPLLGRWPPPGRRPFHFSTRPKVSFTRVRNDVVRAEIERQNCHRTPFGRDLGDVKADRVDPKSTSDLSPVTPDDTLRRDENSPLRHPKRPRRGDKRGSKRGDRGNRNQPKVSYHETNPHPE